MSAYVVSKRDIDSIVRFAMLKELYWKSQRVSDDNANQLGQMLADENYRSVNVRYRNEEGPAYKYSYNESHASDISLVQFFKLLHCLRYQSCEADDYRQTESNHVINSFMDQAIRFIDGYDEAKWGLHD